MDALTRIARAGGVSIEWLVLGVERTEQPQAAYRKVDEAVLRELYLWVEREAARHSAEAKWKIFIYLYGGAMEDEGKLPDERARQRVLKLVISR